MRTTELIYTQGGMGRSVLWLLVLGVGLVCQVQGQQYDPTDCPVSCTCEHPDRMPVGHNDTWDVSNGVYIHECRTDPYDHLVRIFQTYPTVDALQLTNSHTASNMTKLIPEIAMLTTLKLLDISSNNLVVLPNSIGNLSSLKVLYVGGNELTVLPESVGNLTLLQVLSVSKNRLKELPYSIGSLTSLVELSISNNRLVELPASIGYLSSLQRLFVDNNRLKHLPHSIGNLTSLVKLWANNNSLKELPVSIGYLSSLQQLELDDNKLTTLPDTIGNLSKLRWLYLVDNLLTDLPISIGNLSSLDRLDADYNRLTALPDTIGNISTLQWLYLIDNLLTDLPDSMTYLLALSILDISNNYLMALPSNIGQLPLLMEIIAHHNNITSIDISDMVSVPHRVVDLSHNTISSLGVIPAREPNFWMLDLSSNNLTCLSSWFFSLDATPTLDNYVRLLDVSNNAISSITDHDGYSTMPLTMGNVKWQVDLSHNDVQYLHDLSDGLNITQGELVHHLNSKDLILANNPLRCDCVDYTIYEELIHSTHPPPLSCRGPELLRNRSITELELDKFVCNVTVGCPASCFCTVTPYNRSMDIYFTANKEGQLSSATCSALGPEHLREESVAEIDLDNYQCLIETDCPDGCVCTYIPNQDLLTVDCRNYTGETLPHKIPSPCGKTHKFRYTLDFEAGSLVNLGHRDYLQWVENASFSHNQIEEVSARFFDKLNKFNVLKLDNNNMKTLPLMIENWPEKIYLGQNDWICSCGNKPTIRQIVDYKENVEDYLNVSCSRPDNLKNKRFKHVKYGLCSETNPTNKPNVTNDHNVPFIILCTLVVFMLLAVGIVYAKRLWVYKMFKWHPFNRGGADEAMKEFDVFVSYSDDDTAYIDNDILPKLKEFGFKICHHREHFLAGNSIIQNIHRAIMNSKRTLVFFSSAYMESRLCMHEFHTALTVHVMDRCNHLVTIKDSEIDTKTLEIDMRSFFEHYTYIEKGSKHFWDNLLYVLPAERMNSQAKRNAENAAQNGNEFEMVVLLENE